MKRTIKLFSLILTIVMVVSLAACSGRNSKAAKAFFSSYGKATPFSEGLVWSEMMGGATVFNESGKVIYQSGNKLDRSVPFKDGVSFYQSGKNYYIVDKNGKVTYQTPPYSDAKYEKILAYGDGKFLVYRYSREFGSDSGKTLGTIDKNGKETTSFTPVSCNVSSNCDYLGDGVFLIDIEKTFDTTDGKCKNYHGKKHGEKSENGKIWIEVSDYSIGLYDLHTAEYQSLEGHTGKDHYVVNETGIYDGSYYNLNGEEIADIQLYKDKVIERRDFSKEGYTPLVLSDGGKFITYVNMSGEEQFKPIPAGSEYSIFGDLFAVGNKDSGIVTIYDCKGKERYHVENVAVLKDLELYENYFISGSETENSRKYYFFK